MSIADDLVERILRDAPGPEIESEFEARVADLYVAVRNRHSWMYGFFRRVSPNQADVDEMVNETLASYLRDINAELRLTEGLNFTLTQVIEDGELIGLCWPAKVEPIRDLERYTFYSPEGWFATIARNVRNAFCRERAKLRESIVISEWPGDQSTHSDSGAEVLPKSLIERACAPSRNIEERLVAESRRGEIRDAYMTALKDLPAVQRAAWMLCKDELIACAKTESYLAPALHWRTARSALLARPLSLADASRRLQRVDVSSDIFKAKQKLRNQLSTLNPLNGSAKPAPKFAREFLCSSSGCVGILRSSQYRAGRTTSDSNEEYIQQTVQLLRRQQRQVTGAVWGVQQQSCESVSVESAQPGQPNLHKRRTDPVQLRSLRSISFPNGACAYCGGRSVRQSFSPKAIGWTFWCYECGAKDEACRKI